jgi:hypothetical protein
LNNRNTALRTARIGLPVALIFILLASGCTTVKQGFAGTEHEDITPFAQKTVEVLGLQNIQIRDNELVYLRALVDSDFILLDELQAAMARTDFFRDQVITYSVDLVRITEMYDNESDTVAAYADSVDENLRSQVVNTVGMPEQEWDSVIADIRSQDNLLSALQAFQPVVNISGVYYDDLLRQIENEILVDVRAEFDRRIQTDYKQMLQFLNNSGDRREAILEGMNIVHAYQHGNTAAAEKLREGKILLDKSVLPQGEFTAKSIDAIAAALNTELTDNTQLQTKFETDIDYYTRTVDELNLKEKEAIDSLSLARLQFVTWARSHQALASGVKEPGKWMELSLKAGKLLGSAL